MAGSWRVWNMASNGPVISAHKQEEEEDEGEKRRMHIISNCCKYEPFT